MSAPKPSDVFAPAPASDPPEWPKPSERQLELMSIDSISGLVSRRGWEIRKQFAASRWYLVRNIRGETALRQVKAAKYYTKHGIERPFNGLDTVYLLYLDEAVRYIEATQDATADAFTLAEQFFKTAHELGAIEPITRDKAMELNGRIFERGGYKDAVGRSSLRMMRVQWIDGPGTFLQAPGSSVKIRKGGEITLNSRAVTELEKQGFRFREVTGKKITTKVKPAGQ